MRKSKFKKQPNNKERKIKIHIRGKEKERKLKEQ
jgi:hypothetical protein